MNGVDKNLGCAKMLQRPKKERLAPLSGDIYP